MVLVRWIRIRYAGFSVWLVLTPTKAYGIAGIVPALVERYLMDVRPTPVTKGLLAPCCWFPPHGCGDNVLRIGT